MSDERFDGARIATPAGYQDVVLACDGCRLDYVRETPLLAVGVPTVWRCPGCGQRACLEVHGRKVGT